MPIITKLLNIHNIKNLIAFTKLFGVIRMSHATFDDATILKAFFPFYRVTWMMFLTLCDAISQLIRCNIIRWSTSSFRKNVIGFTIDITNNKYSNNQHCNCICCIILGHNSF
ncbi:hypothetical protein AAHE18_11G087400 [Arachis hypogaea]